MTTTLAGLRQAVSERLSDWWVGSLTSAGVSGGTTIVDTKLKNIFSQDDEAIGFYPLLTSGTYINIARKVSAFTYSTGTATVPTSYGGQVANAVTYEMHRFDPLLYVEAINQAIKELFDYVWQDTRDETLIACNALPNGNFEDWTSSAVPDNWAMTTATAAKDTTAGNFWYGKSSMAITGGASSGYAQCGQNQWKPLLDLQGKNITFTAWVLTSTASHCRLAIVDDDGTAYSSYHTGGGARELLSVTRSIKADSKVVAFRVYADVNTAVAYVDQASTEGSAQYFQVLPNDFQQYPPDEVWRQTGGGGHTNTDIIAPDDLGDTFRFQQLFPDKDYWFDNIYGGPRIIRFRTAGSQLKLRLLGRKPLDTFATTAALPNGTGADTTQIDSPRSELLVAQAAAIVANKLVLTGPAEEAGRYQMIAQAQLAEVQRLKKVHGMARLPLALPRR